MAKLFLILGVVATALVGCLWIAGVISKDIASDSLGRSLGIVAILGLSTGAIFLIAGRGKSGGSDATQGPGPKF